MKFLKRLSRREQGWLALAAIVLLVIGINQLVLIPVNQEKRARDRQIEAMRQQLAQLAQTAEQAPLVKREYLEYRRSLARARSDEEMTSRLLGAVEEMAQTTGVEVIATNPIEATRAAEAAAGQPYVDDDWYRIFNIEITAHATVEELVRFLHRVNTGEGSLRVAVLDIAPREQASSQVRWTAKITQLAATDKADPVL